VKYAKPIAFAALGLGALYAAYQVVTTVLAGLSEPSTRASSTSSTSTSSTSTSSTGTSATTDAIGEALDYVKAKSDELDNWILSQFSVGM